MAKPVIDMLIEISPDFDGEDVRTVRELAQGSL